jgi:hypothetical protein
LYGTYSTCKGIDDGTGNIVTVCLKSDGTWTTDSVYSIEAAIFYASTDKNIYAPNELVTVSGLGGCEYWCIQAFEAGWYVSIDTVYPVSTNVFPYGTASDSGGNAGGPGVFNAPNEPGNYNIILTGCWLSSGFCSYASLPITVSSPPTVQLNFSILNKIKSTLENIFAVLKANQIV